jgi:excisionase family DNA binding protein
VAPPLITLAEAAERLTVSYDRACEMARTGILPPGVVVRLGRQVRVNPDALDAFITSGGQALPGGWRQEPDEPTPLTRARPAKGARNGVSAGR